MALFWRIWAAVTLVNLAILAVFVGFATLQFGNISGSLTGERLVVLAEHTAAPFDAAAKLGLPLATVRNADALLERARQTDDTIRDIHVFDDTGRIVHSTTIEPPAEIPADALASRASAGGAPWHSETAGNFLSGIDIRTADGASVGGILIVYPVSDNTARIWAMAAELTLAAFVVLLAAAALGALLLRVGLARQIRMFERIDTTIDRFERDVRRAAAGRPTATAQGESDEFLELLTAAESRYRAEGRKLTTPAGKTS